MINNTEGMAKNNGSNYFNYVNWTDLTAMINIEQFSIVETFNSVLSQLYTKLFYYLYHR